MPEYVRYNQEGIIIQKWYSVDSSEVEGIPSVIKIDRDTFKSLTKYHKVDLNSLTVVAMTKDEIDYVDALEKQQAEEAEADRIKAIGDKIDVDLSGVSLTKIDNAIDNIGNLADAKEFLKKFCRFIVKFTVHNI